MASLAYQTLDSDGSAPSFDAADVAGDQFDNRSVAGYSIPIIHLKNGSGSPITVTPVIIVTIDGQTVVPKTVTVPAGGEAMISGLSAGYYGNTVSLTYSDVTSLTIAILRTGPR